MYIHKCLSPPPRSLLPSGGADLDVHGRAPCVRTQEKACSSDSLFRRKLSGTTDIVFWERCLRLKRESELQAFSCVLTHASS